MRFDLCAQDKQSLISSTTVSRSYRTNIPQHCKVCDTIADATMLGVVGVDTLSGECLQLIQYYNGASQ